MEQIRDGRYAPAPVRRAWIAKPDGSERPLGIPTVLDRVIQQAMAQVLCPIFDADFSDNSYGFRYGRRAHAAVERLSEASQAGYRWGVDCDLKSYWSYGFASFVSSLRSSERHGEPRPVDAPVGQASQGQARPRSGGQVPARRCQAWGRQHGKDAQRRPARGAALTLSLHSFGLRPTLRMAHLRFAPSPLLANVMLDPLDKRIEAMQLPFARYADDFLILARTKDGAIHAMAEVKDYVEGKLKLLVNQNKSQDAPLRECGFLGFHIQGKKIRRTDKAARRFKFRVQQITARSRGVSMRQRLIELRRYCVGWFHYFKYGLPYNEVLHWDQWIRRRVRLCYWKDWKVPRKRRRMLIKLGVTKDQVKKASRSRKGYWRMSRNSLVNLALNGRYLEEQGVPSMRTLWVTFKYGDKATL